MAETERHKKAAAVAAVERIQSGQVVGLGTGSTVRYAIEELGARLRQRRLGDVVGIPTSNDTAALAAREGIPLTEVGHSPMALAIDGADEITPALNLTKGGGGALLREKIVAAAAYQFIVIADRSKLVERLGSTLPIPIEVARFGISGTLDQLRRYGSPMLREAADEPFITDNGNYIVDLQVESIENPLRWSQVVSSLPGVLDTGIFVGLTAEALIADIGGVRSYVAR